MEKLTKLHEMLCDELTRRLKDGESLTASELNVIRQFLKDNNVDAIPAEGSALENVIQNLPDHFFKQ